MSLRRLWDGVDLGGVDLGASTGDDFVGCLLAVMLSLAALIAVFITLQVVVLVVPPLLYGIYRATDRALRSIFARSRDCRGNLSLSLWRGFLCAASAMAVLYAGTWLAWAAWLVIARR